MPIVKIDMWAGKTDEEKEKLIKGITEAFAEIDVPNDHVHVVINENPPENWSVKGEVGSKQK